MIISVVFLERVTFLLLPVVHSSVSEPVIKTDARQVVSTEEVVTKLGSKTNKIPENGMETTVVISVRLTGNNDLGILRMVQPLKVILIDHFTVVDSAILVYKRSDY